MEAKMKQFPRLQGFKFQQRQLDRALLGLSIVALGIMAWSAMHMGHWRHDELEYLDWGDLIYRTQTEGRWLNLIFYYPARIFSPEFGWLVGTALLGSGLAIVFWRIGLSWTYSVIASVILLVFPGYAAQSMWPTSNLPCLAIFFGSAILLARDKLWPLRISRIWILPIAGISLFATIPYFYVLLLPMLAPRKPVRTWSEFSMALIPGIVWSAGLVLGFMVSLLVNGIRYGHYSLRLQDWRIESAPEVPDGAINATLHYAGMLGSDVLQWLPAVSILCWLIVVAVTLHVWLRNGGNLLTLTTRLGYLTVLALMPFLFGAAGHIVVQFRSLMPLALAIVCLPLMFSHGGNWKMVTAVALLVIGLPSFVETLRDYSWFSRLAQANIAAVEEAVPDDLNTDRRALLLPEGYHRYFESQLGRLGIRTETPVFMEGLGHQDFRIGPAFIEAGFADFETCSSDQIDCDALRIGETGLPDCDASDKPICAQSLLADGSLLFRFTDGLKGGD